MRYLRIRFILFLIAIFPFTVSAVEIVRMNIQIGATNQYDLDLELYDTTPITRDNFLSYVGNKGYDKSFIHRSVTDFVIQGGGFTFDPLLGGFEYDSVTKNYPGGLQKIPENAPISNEFIVSGLSNIRGTIAMARSNDLNSATSQWYINQVDNLFLDDLNYTVFGYVLDDGMSVVDLIGTVPIYDKLSILPDFGELPLVNYDNSTPVVQDNLVWLSSVTIIQRPILKSDTDPVDFSFVPIGTVAQKTIILSNTGNADLVMDGASLAAVFTPFSILTETCSNTILRPVSTNPTDTCSVTIQFSTVTTGSYQDNLVVTPSVNPFSIVSKLPITAEAVPVSPVLSVQDNTTVLDFSDVAINTISTKAVVIQNRGGSTLNLSSVAITGLDEAEFSPVTGCSSTTSLLTAETCVLSINFSPLTEGLKSAVLTINSDGGQLVIDLAGNGAGPEIQLSSLVSSSLSLDFGIIQLNDLVTDNFGVLNIGLANLEITSLVITGADAADFTQENSCPIINTISPADSLAQNGVCGIYVTFNPKTEGIKNATLTITTTDSDESVIDISLVGAGGIADIDALQQINVGAAQTSLTPAYEDIIITNLGLASLNFSSVTLTGADSSAYLVQHDCPGTPTTSGSLLSLNQNETCTIAIQFLPLTSGAHNASLEIASNDPDEPVFIINLTGRGELDIDGIIDTEEQNAPNNGDANNDNIQDNVQNNVASFLTNMGVYATVVSPPGTLLYDVSIPPNPSPDDMPKSADFRHGMFKYNIATLNPVAIVGVFMPAGDTSNTYYKYGPTPDNLAPHWYDFSYDGSTGAEYIGQVTVENPIDGSIVNRSMLRITYIDGQRGDDDLTANGQIESVGALTTVASSDGSGSISWYLMVLSALLLMFSRSYLSTVEIKQLRI